MEQMTTGPVTFDDVRAALGDQDPTGTNAGAVRRIIGRGSLSTIQKHLDTLRAQAVQPAAEAPGKVPDAPQDLIQGVWAAGRPTHSRQPTRPGRAAPSSVGGTPWGAGAVCLDSDTPLILPGKRS